MIIKKNIGYILIAIMLILAIFESKNYEANNLDVKGFHFICNQELCEIRHYKRNREIKYVDQIDISKIENFSYKIEQVPRTKKNGMVIYANCKDGTSFRLSPIYIQPSRYLKLELLDPLNKKIKRENFSINITFP